jgi:hypothetical protein
MNTPITDAAELLLFKPEDMADLARRLETDRAALMEALEGFPSDSDYPNAEEFRSACSKWWKGNAITALSAARANFPTP